MLRMNPSKTANPSRGEKVDQKITDQTRKPRHLTADGSAKNHPHEGEPLFGQMIVSPENKMFWHHNLFKQTRYWILKPQTHTHHHTTQKDSVFTGDISFFFGYPPDRLNPWNKPCLSWSDPVETVFREPRFRRGNEI